MNYIFKDIKSISGVYGITLLSNEGSVLYDSMAIDATGKNQKFTNWKKLIGSLGNTREADFIFEKGRFYLRKTDDGYLFVHMDLFASIAMVKLNCDIILPQLKRSRTNKGIKGFFKR
jgi:hypothetical protein